MSDYECVCDVGEGEQWDWSSTTTPVSRKVRKCCECQDVIAVGEKYERTVGGLDGDIQTYITCLFCAEEYARIQTVADFCVPKTELACAIALELRGEL